MLDNQYRHQQIQEQTEDFKEIESFVWKIPECCAELWDSCPHIPKKQSKQRINRGL